MNLFFSKLCSYRQCDQIWQLFERNFMPLLKFSLLKIANYQKNNLLIWSHWLPFFVFLSFHYSLYKLKFDWIRSAHLCDGSDSSTNWATTILNLLSNFDPISRNFHFRQIWFNEDFISCISLKHFIWMKKCIKSAIRRTN